MFLKKIRSPKDLKKMPVSSLPILCQEIRQYLCDVIPKNGGHLGSSLGVVELTVALHYVFKSPEDCFIFDTGHQCYVHKILTSRLEQLKTIRQDSSISGFPKPTESIHDSFVAGHSSTSIGLGAGVCVSNMLSNKSDFVISIIGDAAMQSGVAYEGLNNLPNSSRFITILNDNGMSISKSVGAFNYCILKIKNSENYIIFKNHWLYVFNKCPKFVQKFLNRIKLSIKSLITKENIFSLFGASYLGPINGHDVVELVNIFDKIKNSVHTSRPLVLHLVTKKGLGHLDKNGAHSIDVGEKKYNYSNLASDVVLELAKNDEKVLAITPAMEEGSFLSEFKEKYSNRFFDVGISESHSVLFSSGLASKGFKPFLFIYSTFLQRAFDQLIHDVSISSTPVRFIIDRASFAEKDGSTHNGFFDASFLNSLPNFIIMAPSNEIDTARMIKSMYLIDNKPSAIRINKTTIQQKLSNLEDIEPVEIGKSNVVKRGSKILIISVGFVMNLVKKACKELESQNIHPTIMDLMFIKPLDTQNIVKEITAHDGIVIVEESYIGSASSSILELMIENNVFKKIKVIRLKDIVYDHSSKESFYKKSGLDIDNIIKTCKSLM